MSSVLVSVTVTLSRIVLSSDECVSEFGFTISSLIFQSVIFSPFSHNAKCTVMHFIMQQPQHLRL
jgi:hypothetical protein